jgi:hypothetical protein
MAHRTTILLDDESRRATKQVAARLEVTPSEAVRRAIVAYRDQLVGVSSDNKGRRLRAFQRAIQLFEGHDGAAEIRSLKDQDRYF